MKSTDDQELARVAMALCNWHGCPPEQFAHMGEVERELALDRARVAIDAMNPAPKDMASSYRQWLRLPDPGTLKTRDA